MSDGVDRRDRAVSILEAQIGYHTTGVKRVYLRSLHETPPVDPTDQPFDVMAADGGAVVFSGTARRWGCKWGSWWWVLDFTPLRDEGEFFLRAGELVSSTFRVSPTVLADEKIAVIAVDQLDERVDLGPDDTHVTALKGLYTVAGVTIYRDCGSHYAELPPVGTVVHGLMDLLEYLPGRISDDDRRRAMDYIIMGADYLAAAQQRTGDGDTDGRFYHSLLVNEPHPWAGEVFSYHDMVFAMAVLARAHRAVAPVHQAKAQRYLDAAVTAWTCATHRPRHLVEEFDLPSQCPRGDRNVIPFWTPPGFNHVFARCVYGIEDQTWQLPLTLRTRDRLPFIWGAALLYEITGERRFLDSAAEFAQAVAARQFTDWENPIEGACGNFYEFEDRDDAFLVEFAQGGHWWMGNIEATNLAGLAVLLRLAPDHADAAMWRNVLRTYGEHYVKATAKLSPLGIYPVGCYRGRHGGIKFFQNILCGGTCLYGFAARGMLEVADALQDASYQAAAEANVQFIAGLNPGIPNAYEATAWDAQTLINGVGRTWFGGEHGLGKIPEGAVCNGFNSAEQFWISSNFEVHLGRYPDAPAGIIKPDGNYHFNEDWIAHSHAYVSGVAKVEGAFVLEVQALQDAQGVAAEIEISLTALTEPHERIVRQIRSDGATVVIDDLPLGTRGTVSISAGGQTIVEPLETWGGGRLRRIIDVARYVAMDISAVPRLKTGQSATASLQVRNVGAGPADVSMSLSASGVSVLPRDLAASLAAGECEDFELEIKAGPRVMPFTIIARACSGACVFQTEATGLVASR